MIKKRKIKFTNSIDFNEFETGDKNRLMQEFSDSAPKRGEIGYVDQKTGDNKTSMGNQNVYAPTLNVDVETENGKTSRISYIYNKNGDKFFTHKEAEYEDRYVFEKNEADGKYKGYIIKNSDIQMAFGEGGAKIPLNKEYTLSEIEGLMNDYTKGNHSNNKPINVEYMNFGGSGKDPSHFYFGKGEIKEIAPNLHKALDPDKRTGFLNEAVNHGANIAATGVSTGNEYNSSVLNNAPKKNELA